MLADLGLVSNGEDGVGRVEEIVLGDIVAVDESELRCQDLVGEVIVAGSVGEEGLDLGVGEADDGEDGAGGVVAAEDACGWGVSAR